jgi:hypothetical protein
MSLMSLMAFPMPFPDLPLNDPDRCPYDGTYHSWERSGDGSDYPVARAILHDLSVIEDNWELPERFKGKAHKAFHAVLQFEKDHGFYVEGSGEEARFRLVRAGQRWMPSPSDFERSTGHEREEYDREENEEEGEEQDLDKFTYSKKPSRLEEHDR